MAKSRSLAQRTPRRDFLARTAALAAAGWLPRAVRAHAAADPRLVGGIAGDVNARVDALLGELSLERKIGQLLMVGVSGAAPSPEVRAMLVELQPGAVILLGRNIRTPAQLAPFTSFLQEDVRGVPRLIAMDQEGGTVVRLARGATVFPGAMATGATQSPALAWLEGKVSGAELLALGVNMNLAPVLDVNSNRANPVIGVRAFGDDPKRVAAMGKAYALGLQAAGVAAVAKHFPGHGDAFEDSHHGLPTVDHDLARLRAVELIPFRAAAAAGIDAMMSAHLVFRRVDEAPATMSKVLLTDVLRGELAFDGILMSDDLEMKAIDGSVGVGPAAVRSIAAGADMLMIIWRRSNKDLARDALLAAVKDGSLPLARVDEAVRRILTVKVRRGIIGIAARPASAAVLATVGGPHHLRVAREIARRAMTVVWNRENALPFTPERIPRLAVLSGADGFLAEMRAVRAGSVEVHLPARPDAAARARVIATATRLAGRVDGFVMSVTNESQAELAGALARALGGRRPVAGVALGAPYLLERVAALDAHVCAYGWRPDSLRAAARVVVGLDEAPGETPVRLAFGGQASP